MLWGGWGERKSVPRALSIFSIIDILMGIPSWSLCGGESFRAPRVVAYERADCIVLFLKISRACSEVSCEDFTQEHRK